MGSILQEKGKSTVALSLGIAGAILGIAAGVLAMLIGGAGLLFTTDAAEILWLGMVAVILGITGGVGGLTAKSNPRLSTVVMGIAGIGGFFAVTIFWIIPGVLFLLGAYIAWSSHTRRERPVTA